MPLDERVRIAAYPQSFWEQLVEAGFRADLTITCTPPNALFTCTIKNDKVLVTGEFTSVDGAFSLALMNLYDQAEDKIASSP
jgi:hypothetical protein